MSLKDIKDMCLKVSNVSKKVIGNLSTTTFRPTKKGFVKHEEGFKVVQYYGGKDTCQGDSGGPM